MADLMASLEHRRVNFSRGDEVEGEVITLTDNEVILDLGAKAEGILSKRDLLPDQLESLKVGDSLKLYIAIPENESSQVVLTPYKQFGPQRFDEQNKRWQKFVLARERQSTLLGKIVEVNKGGLLAEVEGVRGFIPGSQISLTSLSSKFTEGLVGQEVRLKVMEVDPAGNRLVFSARGEVSQETEAKLGEIQVGKHVTGKVSAVTPFGLFVEIDLPAESGAQTLEGIVFNQEISWQGTPDPGSVPEVGQKIEAKVINKDEGLGRVNLSIRQLQEDPFTTLAEKFEIDDVVKGTVTEANSSGILVALGEGVEGFIPASKMETGSSYIVGQSSSFLIDSIDHTKRRINLAPFLVTTKGLIYK